MTGNLFRQFDIKSKRFFVTRKTGFGGYLTAIIFVGLAVLGRSALSIVDVNSPPYVIFFPALTLVAVIAGFGPGILSLFFSFILIDYMFIPPFYTFTFKFVPGTFWSNLTFILGEAMIIVSVEIMYRNYINAQKEITVMELAAKQNQIDRLLRQFFDLPFVGMAITDPLTKRYLRFNDHMCDILGYTREELEKKTWVELTHPDDLAVNMKEYTQILNGESDGYQLDKRLIRKDGEIIYASVAEKCVRNEDGSAQYFIKIVEDITKRNLAEAAIQKNEKILKSTLEILPVGVWIMDATGKIISGNRASKEIWAGARYVGIEEFKQYKGWWLDSHQLIGAHEWAAARALEKGETSLDEEIEIECFDGTHKIILNSALPLKHLDGSIEGAIIINQDITVRKRDEEKIYNMAFYDTLTQLPNRRLLFDRLELAMAASQRSRRYSALLFLDLDKFKYLNDSYGHDIGDMFLIELANRIKHSLREVDTVARLGGDEFVIILNELHSDKKEAEKQTLGIAEKIRTMLAIPFVLKTTEDDVETIIEHQSGSSMGAVLFLDHKKSQEDILKYADQAMYLAKEAGGNTIRFFEA